MKIGRKRFLNAPIIAIVLVITMIGLPPHIKAEVIYDSYVITCNFDRQDPQTGFFPFINIITPNNERKSLALSDDGFGFDFLPGSYSYGRYTTGLSLESEITQGEALISQGSDGFYRIILFQNSDIAHSLDIMPQRSTIYDFNSGLGSIDGDCNVSQQESE